MTKKIWYRSEADPLEEIKNILFRDGISQERFFLFGSRARWDYDRRSDYDIAITSVDESKKVDFTRSLRLQSQLNQLPRNIDLVDLTRASPFFRQEIAKDMIELV